MKKRLLIFLVIVFASIIGGCSDNANVELINRDKLVVAVNGFLDASDMENTIEKSIIDKLSQVIGVESDFIFVSSVDEAKKLLDENGADIMIGNIVSSAVFNQDYLISFVYDYQPLYCVTVREDYAGLAEYIEWNKVILSDRLTNDMVLKLQSMMPVDKKDVSSMKRKIKNGNKIFDNMVDETVEYLVGYKKELIRVVESNDELYMYKIEDIRDDE